MKSRNQEQRAAGMSHTTAEGVLLVNKPAGRTSFSLVGRLRKLLNVKKYRACRDA